MAENINEPEEMDPLNAQSENHSIAISTNNDAEVNSGNKNTEKMEVHHHAHHQHEKKTWKSYFWEFFMLFLAVFCGFLAELQLEHYIEHQREKKYIIRIYNDLKRDTAFYKAHEIYQRGVYNLLDSSVQFLHKDLFKNNPDLFYKMLLRARTTKYLEYYSTAFDQMKSSGNLRLIRKENILDSILSYYYTIEKRALIADNRYLEAVTETNKALNFFWDAGYFTTKDSLGKNKSAINMFGTSNASFPEVPFIYKLQLKNILFQRKSSIVNLRIFTLQLDQNATRLLKLIEKEYELTGAVK